MSETYLGPAYSVNLSKYVAIRQNRPGGKGGMAFLVREDLDIQVFNITTDYLRPNTQIQTIKI